MSIRDAVAALGPATNDLIQATYPISDPDLCEDPRVVEFIHAVTEYAAATVELLNAMVEATEESA